MHSPAFTLPTDAELDAEIKEVLGIDLTGLSAPEVDAFVSDLLRQMGDEDRDIQRDTEAMEAEIARIKMRYTARIEAAQQRRRIMEAQVCSIAETADFGKRKSRAVGHGTYGRKMQPERVKVLDKEVLLHWAQAEKPELVESAVVYSVPHAKVVELVKTTGELPPGVDYTEAKEVAYAKVDGL